MNKARKLVEDAYWQEFEGSAMETAVRRHLGFHRAGEIEGLFRAMRPLVREVVEGKAQASAMADRSRELLLALVSAGQDLDRLGVTDRSKVASTASASGATAPRCRRCAGPAEGPGEGV